MSNLSDLIARVEAASGPDRELDALIDCAIRFPALRPARPSDHKEHQLGFPPSKGDIWCPTGFLMARSYTRLIDDALTLLPEGWWLTLDRYCLSDKKPDPFAWRVWLKRLVGDVDGDGPCGLAQFFATGSTAPIALLSAILKARRAAGGRV